MNCREYEEAIYTYGEIGEDEQEKVKHHLATCEDCQKLFNDVEHFSRIVIKVSNERESQFQSSRVTDKVMSVIERESHKRVRQLPVYFNFSISRFSLAAVSCGILVLFFIEILVPDLQSGKIKGPISNIQGAIIRSEDFRKVFTRSKEKRSLFDDCRNILSNQVDTNCVKEKLNNINF